MIKLQSWHSDTVCGAKGSGKTWLIKHGIIPALQASGHEVFVFDVLEEFTEYPHYVPQSDSPKELDRVAKIIWNRWNCTLIVSEAELYLPVTQQLQPNVFKIITRGRHRNVGIVADTRRIANLNKTIFGLSEHVFIFHHWSPTDLDYLKGFVPRDVRELATLPLRHFWHYTEGKVEVCEPI